MFVEVKAPGEAQVMTRLQKLERLRHLAQNATGDQREFCSCLWHDAIADPVFLAAGLNPTREPRLPGSNAAEFFGYDGPEPGWVLEGLPGRPLYVWGPRPALDKSIALGHEIELERARWGG